jgi:SAM-dependent methyltransferase
MQITSGFRSVLSRPIIYSAFQKMMGAKKDWSDLAKFHIRALKGNSILDIGCGPADILYYLPELDYWGFDISEDYVKKAKEKYGSRGRFFSKTLSLSDLENMPSFDLVIACGLLHHVDDETAKAVFKLAYSALKPGGRMITIDPCYDPKQSMIARFLISKDRGQNVRNREGYEVIAKVAFSNVMVNVKHKSWIPYTHCIMECTR